MIRRKKEKAKKKRYWRKRAWLKVVLIIFGGLSLFILVSTFLIIPSNRFSQSLLRQVNQRLRQDFSLIVEANSLRMELWRGKVQARDLKIWTLSENKPKESEESSEASKRSVEPILCLQRVSLNLSLLELIKGKFHCQEILIDSPLLNLKIAGFADEKKAEELSLSGKSLEGKKPKRAWRFQIDHLYLKGGKLNLAYGQVLSQLVLQEIGVEITFDESQREHGGFVSLEKGEIILGKGPALALAPSRLDFRFNEREIFLDSLFVRGDGLFLEGNSHLLLAPVPSVKQARFEGQINLEKISFMKISAQNDKWKKDVKREPRNLKDYFSELVPEISLARKTSALGFGKGENQSDPKGLSRERLFREEKLWGEKKETIFEGKLHFSLDLTRKEEELRGHFQLDGKEVVVSFHRPFSSDKPEERKPLVIACPHLSGELKGGLKGKVITLERAEFNLPGLQFSSSGLYDGNRFEAQFQLNLKDLSKILKEMKLEDYLSSKLALLKERWGEFGETLLAGEMELKGKISGRLNEDKNFLFGNWPEVEGEVEFSGKNLVTPLGKEGEFTLKAAFQKEKISFTRANFLLPPGELSLSGFLFLAPAKYDSLEKSDLQARLKIKDLSQLADAPLFKYLFNLGQSNPSVQPEDLNPGQREDLVPLSGILSLEARVRGDLRKPRLTFSLEARDLAIIGERIASIELGGHFNQRVLTITSLQLKKIEGASAITGSLAYDLGQRSFQVKIEAPPHNLADFSRLQSLFPLQGFLGFRMEITGEKNKIYYDYRVDGNNINSKIFSLPRFQAEGNGLLKGGRIEATSLTIDLRPSGFSLYYLPIETPEPISFVLRDETIFISGLNLKEKDLNLSLQGSLGLRHEKGELQLEARLPLDLAGRFFSPELKEKFSGRGEILIKGQIGGFLIDLKPDVTLSLTEGSFTSSLMNFSAERINLLARLDQEALALENLSFNLGQGSVFLRAFIPLPPKLVPPHSFTHFSQKIFSLPRFQAEGNGLLKGGRGAVPPSNLVPPYLFPPYSAPSPDFNSVPPYLFPIISFNSGQPYWFPQNSVLPSRGKLQEGKSNEEKGPEAEIDLLFSNLNPLDLLGPALKNLPPDYQEKIEWGEIGGEISGEIKFSFLPSLKKGLSSLRGEGKIESLKIKFAPVSLANKKPILFQFKSDLLILEESILDGENLEIRWAGEIKNPLRFNPPRKQSLITGSQNPSLISDQGGQLTRAPSNQPESAQIKVAPEAYVDLAVKASGDLETFSSFLKNINLRGKAALNLYLTGPISSLKPRALAELRSLSLQLIDWPLRLSDTTGTFSFDGQKLEIQSCRGLANGAAWEVAGFLELEEKQKLEKDFRPAMSSGFIQLVAKEVPFDFEGIGSTEVSLSLKLEPVSPETTGEREKAGEPVKGEKRSWLLSGTSSLKRTFLSADIGPIFRLTRAKPKIPRRGTAPAPPPFLQDLNLNVQLELEDPVVISNPFLKTEIQGALTLTGPASSPSLLGRFINSGPGELLWTERRYRLEKMQIAFTGAFPPDPQLELLATTELIHRYDELEVSLNLSGPVSELRFQLQSTPPRSQEELAFILLTGRSPEEIRTQGLAALREQLLLGLATPTASRLGGAMRRLFGLEEVRFEPLGIAGETDPGARLTLIKQITPAARITSSIDITNSQRQTWAVDYRLTEGMILQGLRLDNGSYGVGLRHSLSFGREWLLSEEESSLPKEKQISKAGRLVSRIELKGNLVFPENLIRKKLGKLRPGKEFTSSLLDRQIRALESFYRKKGFLKVKIEPQVMMTDTGIKDIKTENSRNKSDEKEKRGFQLSMEELSPPIKKENPHWNLEGERKDEDGLKDNESGRVEIILVIETGPKIELTFEGAPISRNLKRQIEAIWTQEQSYERAATGSTRLIEKALKGKGYYQASAYFKLRDLRESRDLRYLSDKLRDLSEIRNFDPAQNLKSAIDKEIFGPAFFHEGSKPENSESEKLNCEEALSEGELKNSPGINCHFLIKSGPRFRLGEVRIEGAPEGRGKRLLQEIKSWRTAEARGLWLFIVEPKAVVEAIQSWYESQGYLNSKVAFEIQEKPAERLLNINLLINEGPMSRVGEIRIEGNEAIKEEELRPLLRLRETEPFNPELVPIDRNNLLSFYRSRGFRDASVYSSAEMIDGGPDVRIIFQIKDGVAYKIGEVNFSGVRENWQKKLIKIFGLKPGEPLSLDKISLGQKSLYETGDFNLVQVMMEPLPGLPGQERVRVELRPEPAINVRYGLRYNTEEKTEFTAGVDFRHFFGLGRHGLIHFLHNARESDFRFSFHDRTFLGLKVNSLLSFYLTRRKEAGFTTDEAGASWRQQLSLPGKIFLSPVIRRSRIHTYETEPIGPWPFDISLSLTELVLQAVRDTRDDPLDPRRGSFFSSSLTYSPEALKSELTYLSWFGQASLYLPLSSRLTWASNLRLGLATAFDQVMVPARRFYAGGAYSLRGFKQDMVGPYDPYLDQPEGGEAVFISNQELRWRFLGGLEGVIFYDAGNVFSEVADLNLSQLRHSLGFGLRLRSPIGLLRFDVGFNLKPKPGEPRHLFFFSLGPLF